MLLGHLYRRKKQRQLLLRMLSSYLVDLKVRHKNSPSLFVSLRPNTSEIHPMKISPLPEKQHKKRKIKKEKQNEGKTE
jgi:hypothetical protein